MDKKQFDEIKTLREQILPPPYHATVEDELHFAVHDEANREIALCKNIKNVEFFAHAPEYIDTLLAKVERLNTENAPLLRQVQRLSDSVGYLTAENAKLREKQTAKPVKRDGYMGFDDYECPVCGANVEEHDKNGNTTKAYKFCQNCGQKLLWEE